MSGIQVSPCQSVAVFREECLLAISRQNWSNPLTKASTTHSPGSRYMPSSVTDPNTQQCPPQTRIPQTWTLASHIKCLEVVQTSKSMVPPLYFLVLFSIFLLFLLEERGCQLTLKILQLSYRVCVSKPVFEKQF